jgi:hypothetical protein
MEIKLQLSRKPTGKVSQLPPDLVEYVNCAIQDGVKYDEIIRQLAERGHTGFNKNNLSRWRRSGHCQWLLAQERNDAMRMRCEASLSAARELGPVDQQKMSLLNDALVTTQLTDTLWAFHHNHPDLNKKPENWFKIVKLVNEYSRETVQHKKIAIQTEMLRRALGVNQGA